MQKNAPLVVPIGLLSELVYFARRLFLSKKYASLELVKKQQAKVLLQLGAVTTFTMCFAIENMPLAIDGNS